MVSPIPSPLPIQMPSLRKTLWAAADAEPTEPKREAPKPRESQKQPRVVDFHAVSLCVFLICQLRKRRETPLRGQHHVVHHQCVDA